MADTSIKKIDSTHSPEMKNGEKFLASGKGVSMRMWEDESPNMNKPEVSRPYETVGYVLKGKAELHSEGQVVTLEAGDSYLVPKEAKHTYKILEPFSAVEATSPPSQVHSREE
ncbi:quercetin dioxygenase-like cupin family protein [Catalinimonas alkaloidigena]|uniref:cupin domain-containing protein n=1 Tax=Catalinimonas alkaloidigena TaxID=1075417 RepID=UPI0024072CB7|nr:cupin domain-containing protein [Catalinimonas alkaloidigena]MDF9800690.1 quercetin dioxygenase-like cupin family protein [Catalinimonas alkaloidigena]